MPLRRKRRRGRATSPARGDGKRRVAIVALVALALSTLTAFAQRAFDPEGASGLQVKTLAHAKSHMVAAANPHAVEAGLEILKAGGSAIDAAIAAQLVLNLVEPQSSGIGGGGFLLHWDERARRLRSYDGRETAPAAVKPELFLRPDGRPRGFLEALYGGDSVGAPGLVAHAGRWRTPATASCPGRACSEPAIALAKDGFVVSPRLSKLITDRGAALFAPEARGLFLRRQRHAEAGRREAVEPGICGHAGGDRCTPAPMRSTRGRSRTRSSLRSPPRRRTRAHLRKPISPATWPRSARRRA